MADDVHAFPAAKVDREQPGGREAGRNRTDSSQTGDERQANRDSDGDEDGHGLAVEHNHQHQRADRITEEDVPLPEQDVVRRTEDGQGQHAPQVDDLEFPSGLRRARQHHGESHAEEQRENRPEFALHEIRNEPAGKPVDAGEATRHALVEAAQRAVEVLDVHQEDAEQREPPHHIQGFDPLIQGNRHQDLVGHWRRWLDGDRFHRWVTIRDCVPDGSEGDDGS